MRTKVNAMLAFTANKTLAHPGMCERTANSSSDCRGTLLYRRQCDCGQTARNSKPKHELNQRKPEYRLFHFCLLSKRHVFKLINPPYYLGRKVTKFCTPAISMSLFVSMLLPIEWTMPLPVATPTLFPVMVE